MNTRILPAGCGLLLLGIVEPPLRADLVEMQNGDRYSGKVLSMSADTLVFSNDVLGKISVPRTKVVGVTFAPAVAPSASATNRPVAVVTTNLPAPAKPALTNAAGDLSAELRRLGANSNVVAQVRQQMLAGSPEAGGKFDELVSGLMTGKLNVQDIRREAQTSAKQLEELKRELGDEAGELLDSYLEILNGFLKETAPAGKPSP